MAPSAPSPLQLTAPLWSCTCISLPTSSRFLSKDFFPVNLSNNFSHSSCNLCKILNCKIISHSHVNNDIINTNTRVRKTLNSELWHACAGPLVSLPQVEILVYYLPQGHSEKFSRESADGEDGMVIKMDGELWQSLESCFVSIILALSSADQAKVLTEWLENECIRYPDLTEAFEVQCYRSKVAKRRLSLLGDDHAMTNSI
nr:uncharacterized protein LOC112705293 [Arachis hypogaea]